MICPCEVCVNPREFSFNRYGEGTVPSKYNCICIAYNQWKRGVPLDVMLPNDKNIGMIEMSMFLDDNKTIKQVKEEYKKE